MELLPAEIRQDIPPLYSTRSDPDPKVWVKFFTPWSFFAWYVTEIDVQAGDVLFYGWVDGMEAQFGYFLLSELEKLTGPNGQKIERKPDFISGPLSMYR